MRISMSRDFIGQGLEQSASLGDNFRMHVDAYDNTGLSVMRKMLQNGEHSFQGQPGVPAYFRG